MKMTKMDFEEYIKLATDKFKVLDRNRIRDKRKDKIKKINGNEVFKSNTTVL